MTLSESMSINSKEKKKKKIGVIWSHEEDQRLLQAVEWYGEKRWVDVAKAVGTRTRKQCRERFVNHISPKIIKRPWTAEEDAIILKTYHHYKNKWSEIGRHLQGRTARSVRNRYRTLISKQRLSCFHVVDKSRYCIIIGEHTWF